MFGWVKALFGSFDRQTVAAERAAKALEDIATDLESVRDQFRARLGIEAPQPAAVVVTPIAAMEEASGPAKGRKGKTA